MPPLCWYFCQVKWTQVGGCGVQPSQDRHLPTAPSLLILLPSNNFCYGTCKKISRDMMPWLMLALINYLGNNLFSSNASKICGATSCEVPSLILSYNDCGIKTGCPLLDVPFVVLLSVPLVNRAASNKSPA